MRVCAYVIACQNRCHGSGIKETPKDQRKSTRIQLLPSNGRVFRSPTIFGYCRASHLLDFRLGAHPSHLLRFRCIGPPCSESHFGHSFSTFHSSCGSWQSGARVTYLAWLHRHSLPPQYAIESCGEAKQSIPEVSECSRSTGWRSAETRTPQTDEPNAIMQFTFRLGYRQH